MDKSCAEAQDKPQPFEAMEKGVVTEKKRKKRKRIWKPLGLGGFITFFTWQDGATYEIVRANDPTKILIIFIIEDQSSMDVHYQPLDFDLPANIDEQ